MSPRWESKWSEQEKLEGKVKREEKNFLKQKCGLAPKLPSYTKIAQCTHRQLQSKETELRDEGEKAC